MATAVSQCPEDSNSTDCLLRTLLQLLVEYREADNAAVDWDPISFAFTLLIGLVAIFFALATVIQAIFAAEKGRRRTSQLAIGKWFKETKREWDWSEMNFRYTVTTPILHEESLPSYDRIESESRPNQSGRPSAAWLEFFEEVGLNELGIEAWRFSTRKVVANYLPDDITAAPAYAQVGAIVAAAAMAGIQKVDIDTQTSRNYPILFGQGFQIDFRQHPVLGVVCAYSRYGKTRKESGKLDIEQLGTAIKNGRGFVDDHKMMDISTGSTRRRLIERWSRLGEAHATSCASWSATFALKSSAISEAHLPLIIGMFADKPKYFPALFPTATMETNNCLTVLALSGTYWAKVHLDTFTESDISGCPRWNGFVWPLSTERERAMSRKVQEHYLKLSVWRKDPIDPWLRDIREGDEAQQKRHDAHIKQDTIREPAKQHEQETANRARQDEERARIEKDIARLHAEEEERDAPQRPQLEEETASAAAAGTRLQAEEEERDAPQRPQLEEETASAAAAGTRLQAEEEERAPEAETLKAAARPAVIAEARLPIEKRTTNPDASGGIPTDSQQETKAEVTIGHYLVLQACLQLLHDSSLLEKWISEASSDSLRFLRGLVHRQIKRVDQWLSDKEGIKHRSIILCNTTIVLLRVEQMIGESFFDSSGSEEPQNHGVQGGSVEQQQTQGSNRERPEQGTASRIHFNMLQVLRNIVDGKVRGASELENLLHYRSDSSLLRDRLKALVVYHSRLWDQAKHEEDKNEARDIDDVIIYRCLMMILLFRTAADSSKILESGIWDQVVPII